MRRPMRGRRDAERLFAASMRTAAYRKRVERRSTTSRAPARSAGVNWPKTLFGRNVLLIVGLMALAQIGSALAVRELIIRPRADLIADALARNIGGMRAGLLKLAPEQRVAFVDEFNRRGLEGARDSAGDDPTRQPLTRMERRFVRQVSQRIAADGAEIYWRREAGGSLAVRLPIDGSNYWITL